MKKFYIFLTMLLPLCACTGMSSFDGNSTKQWVTIESSKQDLEGKTIDVCYRFDVRFSPQEVTNRFDTDKACITRCCWYSETRQVNLNLNTDFAKELAEEGQANKYVTDKLVFNVRYSNLLNTIHATVKPNSALRSDGLINLDYTLVKEDPGLLKIDLGDLKPHDFSQIEENKHEGKYLYTQEEEAMRRYQEHIREMQDYQRVDTGITRGEPEPATKVVEEEVLTPDQVVKEEASKITTQKTVIGTLQTQKDTPTSKINNPRETYEYYEEQAVYFEEEPFDQQIAKAQKQERENVYYHTEVYNLNDPTQRQTLLEKKLAYERNQAVELLRRFYQQDIDEYIRHIDKEQREKGYVLLANDREWKTTKVGYPIYRVKCSVNGKLGKTQKSLKEYLIPCGVYEVDLDENTVAPKDITAITIVNKDYKY